MRKRDLENLFFCLSLIVKKGDGIDIYIYIKLIEIIYNNIYFIWLYELCILYVYICMCVYKIYIIYF